MKESALSIANYFIDLAHQSNEPIKPLKLMKLVYIAHGYMLAILDKSVLNPRFDQVEAWRYGPVIPSVYHSFKQYGDTPIDKKTIIFDWEHIDDLVTITPELENEDAKKICNFVWNRYKSYSDNELVTLLHGVGTPWGQVYQEGANRIIPDELTKLYYRQLVRRIINSGKNG